MAVGQLRERPRSASVPEGIERHTMAVLVDNEPGVLARVIGLFSGRGYNIESLTVAQVETEENLSRITVVTSGTPMVIEQIKNQLGRLVPVRKVHDLTAEGAHIERDHALIKVVNSGEKRVELLQDRRHLPRPRRRQHDEVLRVRDDRLDRQDRCLHSTHARARPDRDRAQRRGGDRPGCGHDLVFWCRHCHCEPKAKQPRFRHMTLDRFVGFASSQ